jgi:biopolymer transport protein ExbD
VVTLLPDDRLQLNGIELGREELLARIRSLAETGMDMPVLISGDRKASLGAGIELLEKMKNAGMGKVSFQVSGGRQGDGQR